MTPPTPPSGLINLPELLSEFRDTFNLLDCGFIIKGYYSGTARWKGCIDQGMGKGQGTFMPNPGMLLSPNLFFKDFIYLFLERGEGREKGKKH